MIRVLLIGYGHIGRKHVAALEQVPHIEVCGIVEPGDMVDLDDQIHYRSLDTGLDDAHADVAVICSPNHLHATQAITCLNQGLHVLIEKPMAIHRHDVESIIEAAINNDRRVFGVMQLRYSPIVQALKQCVDSGRLGDIHHVEVRCLWNRGHGYYLSQDGPHPWRGRVATEGGPLFTQFSHFVDLIYHLFGSWRIDYCRFSNLAHQGTTEFEDMGDINFHIGDISGSMFYTTAVFDKNFESTITILGSEGSVSVGGQYFGQVRYSHPPGLLTIDDAELKTYQGNKLLGHIKVYENIVDVLTSPDQRMTTNAVDGLKVVNMIEEVYRRRT